MVLIKLTVRVIYLVLGSEVRVRGRIVFRRGTKRPFPRQMETKPFVLKPVPLSYSLLSDLGESPLLQLNLHDEVASPLSTNIASPNNGLLFQFERFFASAASRVS